MPKLEREPTEEMIEQGVAEMCAGYGQMSYSALARNIWRRMYDAAPPGERAHLVPAEEWFPDDGDHARVGCTDQ